MNVPQRIKYAVLQNVRDWRNWMGVVSGIGSVTVYSSLHGWGRIAALPLLIASVAFVWGPARDWNRTVWGPPDLD